MKRSILFANFTAAAFIIATSPALAQHGRPASPGSAAGSMGATHSNASSHSGSGSGNAGTNGGAKSADQLLNDNSHLTTNLQKLLPTGTTPQQVCANFTNLGKCVAAIHVSRNLGIDLNSLVCDMTLKPIGSVACPAGTATGSKGMSLGASIAALDPNVSSKTESKKASQQARQDLTGS